MEASKLLNLLQSDGEVGQPRLRQSHEHLYVVVTKRWHVLCLLLIGGPVNQVSDQLNQANFDAEEILADCLDELERLFETAGIEVDVDAFVVLPDVDSAELAAFKNRLPIEQSLCRDQLSAWGEFCDIDQPLNDDAFAKATELLFPKRGWQRVELVKDEGRLHRQTQRAQLDEVQKSAAWGLDRETIGIDGGPGTGKSLVLSARAKWLVDALGDKCKILMLVWNRTLALALNDWLIWLKSQNHQVEVLVLAEFFERHSIAISLADPEDADRRCSDLLRRKTQQPQYDAILIDEAQDLGGTLIELVEQFVIPNRGGLTLSYDSQQNIRARPPIEWDRLRGPAQFHRLNKAYRSTPPIHEFIHRFGGFSAVATVFDFDDCEPVRLVWAESPNACDELVVFETQRLVNEVGLLPSEIMVVVFSTSHSINLKSQFADAGVATGKPSDKDNQSVRIASPEVAKGHEASCVFVVGWDEYLDLESEAAASRRFVATSRAADILYVAYSSQEVPDKLLQHAAAIKQLWPDDFRS